jgi:hypothetical protein
MATGTRPAAETTEPLHAPGPVARLVTRLAEHPVRGAGLVLGLFAGQVVWAHAVLWASGQLAVGSFDPSSAVLAVYGPFTIALAAFGGVTVRRALRTFWPATGWPEAQRVDWERRFMRGMGRDWAWLLIGFVGALLALAASPESVVGVGDRRIAVLIAYAPSFFLGYALTVPALAFVVHWLRLIDRIHREATRIDPFDRAPLYAFSRVTALVGLAAIALAYYSFTVNGAVQAGNVPSLTFVAVSTIFGVLAFVAPLWGIHSRLAREKERLLLDVEHRVGRLADELYARIDAGDFAATSSLNATLSGLGTLRDRVSRLPTWPWPPQLLRGFISALLLPVIVYLLTRAASGLVGA